MNRAFGRVARWVAIGLHLAACGRLGYSTAAPPDGSAPADAPRGVPDDAAVTDTPPGDDAEAPFLFDARALPGDLAASTARVAACPLLGNAVFCEDFERGLPGAEERPAYEQTTSANGRLALDATARPGSSVLRASIVGGGSGNVDARLTYVLPASFRPRSYHMRAWLYLPAARPPRDWMVLLELAHAGGKVSLDVYDGDYMGVLAIGPTNRVLPMMGLVATPRGRWFCAEVAVELPPSPDDVGHLRLEIDDAPVDNLTLPAGALPAAGFERLFFGMVASRLRDETHVLVDDVVVASAPIGCN